VPWPEGVACDDRWLRARAYLASVVLESAAAYGSLSRLQRDVLVPLELELARTAEATNGGLGQWVAQVENALQEAARRHGGFGPG
jgi:hypothetical protein